MRYTLLHNLDKNARTHLNDGNWMGEYRGWHRLAAYYSGDLEWTETDGPRGGHLGGAAWSLYHRHNGDSRPCGQLGPSLSTGDVIVFHLDGEPDQAAHLTSNDWEFVPADGLVVIEGTYLDTLAVR